MDSVGRVRGRRKNGGIKSDCILLRGPKTGSFLANCPASKEGWKQASMKLVGNGGGLPCTVPGSFLALCQNTQLCLGWTCWDISGMSHFWGGGRWCEKGERVHTRIKACQGYCCQEVERKLPVAKLRAKKAGSVAKEIVVGHGQLLRVKHGC